MARGLRIARLLEAVGLLVKNVLHTRALSRICCFLHSRPPNRCCGWNRKGRWFLPWTDFPTYRLTDSRA
jgi:hypothetical protein